MILELERETRELIRQLLSPYKIIYEACKAASEREIRESRTPFDLTGLRYTQLLIQVLSALYDIDIPLATRYRTQWEVVALARLDNQLFGESGAAAVTFSCGSSAIIEGTDGATLKLSDLIKSDRELLDDLLIPCSAIYMARQRA